MVMLQMCLRVQQGSGAKRSAVESGTCSCHWTPHHHHRSHVAVLIIHSVDLTDHPINFSPSLPMTKTT